MRAIKNKIKNEMASVKKEVRKKTVGYILTALGLVAGLSWNDAVKSAIDHFFPAEQGGLQAKFAYAFAITAAVVLISVYLTRITESPEEKDDKNKKK